MRRIIQHLQANPIVQIACERAGVPRSTYFRWRANDLVFARAADHAQEASRFLGNDVAESRLMQAVKNGEPWAIRFWLQYNHPRYARKDIHEHCHICETKSTEEKHREERRDKRNFEIVSQGMSERLLGSINDRHEHNAHETEDAMFERFEMLNDDTGDDVQEKA